MSHLTPSGILKLKITGTNAKPWFQHLSNISREDRASFGWLLAVITRYLTDAERDEDEGYTLEPQDLLLFLAALRQYCKTWCKDLKFPRNFEFPEDFHPAENPRLDVEEDEDAIDVVLLQTAVTTYMLDANADLLRWIKSTLEDIHILSHVPEDYAFAPTNDMAFTVLASLHASYVVQSPAAVSLEYATLLHAASLWDGAPDSLRMLIAQFNDLHHPTIESAQISRDCVKLCIESPSFMTNLVRADIVRQCTDETTLPEFLLLLNRSQRMTHLHAAIAAQLAVTQAQTARTAAAAGAAAAGAAPAPTPPRPPAPPAPRASGSTRRRGRPGPNPPGQYWFNDKYRCANCGKPDHSNSGTHTPATCRSQFSEPVDVAERAFKRTAFELWNGTAQHAAVGAVGPMPTNQPDTYLVVNNASSYSGACASMPRVHDSHACVNVPASSRSLLDSGCAPFHCAHPSLAHGPLRPSRVVVHAAHGGPSPCVEEGIAVLPTCSVRHARYMLRLPGPSLFSKSFTYRALISHNTLLKHGFKIVLNPDDGHVLTPDGDVIHLDIRNGLYHFPPPRSGPSLLLEPPTAHLPESVSATETLGDLPSIQEESESDIKLCRNLDKWDAIHRTYGHPHHNRMLKLATAMLVDDPARPKLNTLAKWTALRKCPSCKTAAMKRPSADAAHPPVPRPVNIQSGEGLHIDGLGTFPSKTIDGTTDAFLFTDDYSGIKVAFPTTTLSCTALLECVQDYQAAGGVKLKFIRTDNQFLCEPLLSWCRTKDIALSACAPHTHVQNPKAERAVGRVKETMRKHKHTAATSDYLLPYNYVYTCQVLNRQPCDTDPEKRNRSPLSIWPTAPFQHPAQPIAPWGCRTFGFVGKRPDAPNTGMRSRPGINLGNAVNTSGYNVYHPDTDSVFTYGYADYDVQNFPLKDMMLAGELASRDGSINPDGFRQHAIFQTRDVLDGPCAEFLSGKQIQFLLPLSANPKYPASWQVRAHRPVYSPTGIVGLEVEYTKYLGNMSDLKTKADRLFQTQPVLSTLVMSPVSSCPKGWYTTDVRSCLLDTYPTCRTLAEIATQAVHLAGSYPQPKALEQATRRQSAMAACPVPTPTYPKGRMVLPCRKLSGIRSQHATWSQSKHTVLPCRRNMVCSAHMSLAPCPAQPSVALLLPPTQQVGFCPCTEREARSHTTWPLWEAAIAKEISGLTARNTWIEVPESAVPSGTRIMDSKLVFADKPLTGPKARLVVRGDQQWPKPLPKYTYSPTPSATEIRILLSTATANNWAVHSLDISQAFVQSDPLHPESRLYVRPPRNYPCTPGTVWKLNKPLYGLMEAPQAWSNTLVGFLKDYGFKPVNGSSTFFTWSDGTSSMHLVYHVDDILLSFSHDSSSEAFKMALFSRFSGTDMGPVTRYVGIDISRDGNHMHLSQEPLALELLERFDMLDCNSVTSPMAPGELLLESDRPPTPDLALRPQYQECVGTLQYLATWTRPDLQFCTNELSKHMSNPGLTHWLAAKRVLRYLKGTSSLGLTYKRGTVNPNRLVAYADADWATCPETRRSVGAYVVLLNGACVSWRSKKQAAVATSTSEAEFVAASKAADELVWERRIMADLHLPQTSPTPLFEDNRACRLMSENPIHRERSKHIDYRVHALRERVAAGEVILVDCASRDMVADSLTKNLPADSFIRHRDVQLGRV